MDDHRTDHFHSRFARLFAKDHCKSWQIINVYVHEHTNDSQVKKHFSQLTNAKILLSRVTIKGAYSSGHLDWLPDPLPEFQFHYLGILVVYE